MKKIFTYLFAIAALMIISVAAMAQGGASPFSGSSHGYKVTPEDGSNNTLLWEILGGSGGDYDVNTTLNGDSINITWNAGSVGKIFTLRFTETTPAPASCSTIKELEIIPVINTFDVNIGTLTDACNNNSGTVSPADSATSTITIPFEMETGTTWSPGWEVTFTLSVGSSNARIVTVALASGAGGLLTDLGGGSFSITEIGSSSGNGLTSIDVDIKGYSFEDVTIDAEITASKESAYNTPAVSTGSWLPVTNTIYKIPDTSGITTD